MLRTLGVFVAGVLLGLVVMASLIWAASDLPQRFGLYAYSLIDALTGSAVGLFVGFLQRGRAGLVALICLLPLAYLQYVNQFSHPATGLRLLLLLVGTAVELSIAFGIAHRLSKARQLLTDPVTGQ